MTGVEAAATAPDAGALPGCAILTNHLVSDMEMGHLQNEVAHSRFAGFVGSSSGGLNGNYLNAGGCIMVLKEKYFRAEERAMMIQIKYTDGQKRLVRPHELKKLIASKAIDSFERSGGWVNIETGILRNPGGNADYSGFERRSPY